MHTVDIDDSGLKALLDFWISERDYARDCRSVQVELMRKNPKEKASWQKRWDYFDSRYKYCFKWIRYYRKVKAGMK